MEDKSSKENIFYKACEEHYIKLQNHEYHFSVGRIDLNEYTHFCMQDALELSIITISLMQKYPPTNNVPKQYMRK